MNEPVTIPSSPNDRKKLQDAIAEGANCLQRMEDERQSIKDIADRFKEELQFDPKLYRKLIKAKHKRNFAEEQTAYEDFEAAYEILIEGKKD